MLLKGITPVFCRRSGFSLVEVMVSGVLVACSAAAVISVIGTGVKLQTTDNNRRQVRTLIKSEFEKYYEVQRLVDPIPDTVVTETVTIDDTRVPLLQGQLKRVVKDTAITTTRGLLLQSLRITISCRWAPDAETADSLTFTKVIAQAR